MTETAARTTPPEMADLAFFVGEWDAEGTFFTTPFSTEKPIRMTIDIHNDHNGHWLITRTAEHPTPDNPDPLTATYVWGRDTEWFTAEWFDSNGGRAHQDSAGWQGDTLVFTGTMTSGGFTFALRDTFTRRGDDEYHHLGEIDLGNGWIPVDEETARRAPAPPD